MVRPAGAAYKASGPGVSGSYDVSDKASGQPQNILPHHMTPARPNASHDSGTSLCVVRPRHPRPRRATPSRPDASCDPDASYVTQYASKWM